MSFVDGPEVEQHGVEQRTEHLSCLKAHEDDVVHAGEGYRGLDHVGDDNDAHLAQGIASK